MAALTEAPVAYHQRGYATRDSRPFSRGIVTYYVTNTGGVLSRREGTISALIWALFEDDALHERGEINCGAEPKVASLEQWFSSKLPA